MQDRRGFTLTEVLITLVILGVLAGLAIVSYRDLVERSRSAEAITNMAAIRKAELLRKMSGDAFVNASDTDEINRLFGLGIEENLFAYKIIDASGEDFMVIAERINAPADLQPMKFSMDENGVITDLTEGRPIGAGGGPIAGLGADAGLAGGGGGGGGGGGLGGSLLGGGGGGTSFRAVAGTTTNSFSYTGTCANALSPDTLEFIERCASLFPAWADTNLLNITGTDASILEDVFDLVDGVPPYSAVTVDLLAKGISITFSSTDFAPGGVCEGAIACVSWNTAISIPEGPTDPPVMLFDAQHADESLETLATILVHEGTHLQQFIDGDALSSSLSVVDVEFRAFWNMAAYWAEVRASVMPFDTLLELSNESWYQHALSGEAALRARISLVYGA